MHINHSDHENWHVEQFIVVTSNTIGHSSTQWQVKVSQLILDGELSGVLHQ